MKILIKLFFALLLVVSVVATTAAQQSAAETAAGLRAQLADVQAKQSELQTWLAELDEALKPENIQNSLAGVGSVHPEDLREQKKRQLEREKAGVVAQLEKLAISQRRLENAIATADAAAYQQSAQPTPVKGPGIAENEADSPKPAKPRRHRTRRARVRKVQ
jgi:oligoendopeptidase F